MDFLNQGARQLSSRWRGLPTSLRILLVVVAIGATAGTFVWQSAGDRTARTLLFSGAEFTAADLARMEAAFGKSRLAGARVDGQRISVPEALKDQYLKALVDHGALPETFYAAHERALEQDHPFVSQRQRENRMKLARERETALIVRKIRGIEEVCVQYDDVDTDTFPRRKRRRATVAVRANEGRKLEHETVQAIRSTVMTSIGVAQASDITVLDLNAGRAYDGGDGDAVRQAESDYSAAKRRYEEFYQAKIGQCLSMYPGAVVAVTVELSRQDDAEASTPLVPREVTASISLPRSLIVDVWQRDRTRFSPRETRPPEAFELRRVEDDVREQIRRSVAPLLPGANGEELNRALVTVETFADQTAAAAPQGVASHDWRSALVDKEWAIGLGLLACAVIAWTVSRRGRDSHQDAMTLPRGARVFDTSDMRPRSDATRVDDDDRSRGAAEDDRQERLRGRLTDRAKADPRSVAETLKHWMGNVA